MNDAPISLSVPFLGTKIVLVRQYREAWERSSWECPAGHAEPGERPEETARRELEEETGYRAARVVRLMEIRASAKIPNRFTLFSAHDLAAGTQKLDEGEEISLVEAFTPDEVRKLMEEGEIVHGPSLVALLLVLGGAKPGRGTA